MLAGVHHACFIREHVKICVCATEKTGNAFRHRINELMCMTGMQYNLLA